MITACRWGIRFGIRNQLYRGLLVLERHTLDTTFRRLSLPSRSHIGRCCALPLVTPWRHNYPRVCRREVQTMTPRWRSFYLLLAGWLAGWKGHTLLPSCSWLLFFKCVAPTVPVLSETAKAASKSCRRFAATDRHSGCLSVSCRQTFGKRSFTLIQCILKSSFSEVPEAVPGPGAIRFKEPG